MDIPNCGQRIGIQVLKVQGTRNQIESTHR